MTNAKKEQLIDLIEAYGTYQYMMGMEGRDCPAWAFDRLKDVCEQLRDEFGVELIDLTFIA